MTPRVRSVFSRARVLVMVAAFAAVVVIPGAANAETTVTDPPTSSSTDTSTLTLYGVANHVPTPSCTLLTTDDGRRFMLTLPYHYATRDQRDLFRYGIPLGVPMRVEVAPPVGATPCGPEFEVMSVTVLD